MKPIARCTQLFKMWKVMKVQQNYTNNASCYISIQFMDFESMPKWSKCPSRPLKAKNWMKEIMSSWFWTSNIFWRYFTPAPTLGRIVRMILSFKCYFLFPVFYTHTNIAFEIFVQKNFPTKNEKIIFMYTESLMGLDILGKIGFNLALGLVTSCCGYLETYMLLAVARVHEPWWPE